MGSLGSVMAARLIASELDDAGVAPAGSSGYVQEIAAVRLTLPNVGSRIVLVEAADTFPDSAKEFLADRNLVGIVPGSDPAVADEVIVVGAHFDHIGVGRPMDGDSIYNGADDDASGVVAVLEAARDLASGSPPRRTVIFAFFTGEEVGGLGSAWYLDHPAVPLDQTVAQLQVEMIGRPDSLAGGPGMLWATGYERSTVGAIFSSFGVPVVADPYPDENFFFRSDNVRFAYAGIPAHTLSSFNLHEDYHRPSDEMGRVDLDHMVLAVETVIMAVRALADAPDAPAWNEGGRPEQRTGR
jgi:Zn-dependent M28 family amino/carboxypeptidase